MRAMIKPFKRFYVCISLFLCHSVFFNFAGFLGLAASFFSAWPIGDVIFLPRSYGRNATLVCPWQTRRPRMMLDISTGWRRRRRLQLTSIWTKEQQIADLVTPQTTTLHNSTNREMEQRARSRVSEPTNAFYVCFTVGPAWPDDGLFQEEVCLVIIRTEGEREREAGLPNMGRERPVFV